jgi:hypothetical protein
LGRWARTATASRGRPRLASTQARLTEMRSCRRAPAAPSSCEPSGNSNAAVATRCRASLVRVVCAGGGSFSSY